MSELSKFIALLVEYGEKLEGHVNKKYKSFVRKTLSAEALGKRVGAERVVVGKELIVFKLGLQAKSSKAVETSLQYLVRLLQLKFVDLNQPNCCEYFAIEESGVKEVSGEAPRTEVRQQLIALIRQNLHYKNNEINLLIVKVLEFLITEPILDLILDVATEFPHDSTSTLLLNYFSFRFHVYEEICYYSQAELKSLGTLSLRSEKVEKEIRRAQQENGLLQELISRYMQEYLSIIDGSGGRYGRCVMCGEPAEHYCKITKASLCGMDCKKRHIELAEKQYRHQFQASHLWQAIQGSFKELLVFLQRHQSPLVFSVLASLLDKPYLFMVAKKDFRRLLAENVKLIFNRVLLYRQDNCFEHIYYFMASLSKHWLFDCLNQVEYFFKEYVIKVLEDKKPTLRFINLVFKALARIFEHGKTTLQLYINFDCETNRENVIEKVLFELAKIAQDRFAPATNFSKPDKASIKNHSLSLLLILAMGLNQYRKNEGRVVDTSEVVQLKQRKMSLQQFVVRFNEHWTSGLKTLFNLNLVGLDSNEEIVDIFMSVKGLSKEHIAEYFSCEKGFELFDIFLRKAASKHKQHLFLTLLHLHRFIPLKTNSICLKKLIQHYHLTYQLQVEKQVYVYLDFLCKNLSLQELKRFVESRKEMEELGVPAQKLLAYCVEAKQPLTFGNNKMFFTYCCSRSYLEVFANQLALLQIPLSYLLENDYEVERLLTLTEELVQICPHSNWLSLLVKNCSLQKYPQEFDEGKLKIVVGALNILEKQAAFVQDWSTIIHFVSQLRGALAQGKKAAEGRSLAEKISVPILERILLEISMKADRYFGKLVLAVLAEAREEIQTENLFMAQKFFQFVDCNPKKFLSIVDDFMPFLSSFTKHLTKTSAEVCITVADMLKQSFAKLLKVPKAGREWSEGAEAEFWKLFQNLTCHPSKEVKDFVVNCMTMAVLHHYQLSYKSWIALFTFMKQAAKEYRQQIFTIVEKVVAQKLRNCQEFYPDIIDLCLQLVHPTETRISVEALLALKHTVEAVVELKGGQGEEQGAKQARNLIKRVEESLIQLIFCSCHEEVMNTFFRLLGSKASGSAILSAQEAQQLLALLFGKIEGYSPETLQVAEKTLNFALNWSVSHHQAPVVGFFAGLVLDKYNQLSLSAIKCIKTYLQMVNPRTVEEWQPIQNCLLAIAQNTRISTLLDLSIPDKFAEDNAEVRPEEVVRVEGSLLGNKMVVQKLVIEMLPNHRECLQELSVLYREVISFNDNLYLRCLLWRVGLPSSGASRPPDLLTLEDIISSKLVAIYNSANDPAIVAFSLAVFQRYCQASQRFTELASRVPSVGADPLNQHVDLIKDYLQARKVPLTRVMSYFLPKYSRMCKSREEKKGVVVWVMESLKYVANREPYLKCIKQLAKRDS